MTLTDKHKAFLSEVQNDDYRRAVVADHIGVGLAFQLNLLRDARKWAQDELAKRSGVSIETIDQLEDPNCENYSIETLLKLANAFDVGLLVRFVPFATLAEWETDLNMTKLVPPSYEEERNNMNDFADTSTETTPSLAEQDSLKYAATVTTANSLFNVMPHQGLKVYYANS